MEVGRGVPYPAIPFMDRRRRCITCSAIPSLDGRYAERISPAQLYRI
jgi:hypothetical protein